MGYVVNVREDFAFIKCVAPFCSLAVSSHSCVCTDNSDNLQRG